MAVNRIKLFRLFRKSFKATGFQTHQLNRKYKFNTNNWLHFLSLTIMFLSTSSFFLFRATTVYEYGASFPPTNVMLLSLLYFTVFFCHTDSIVQLIERYENFIENSKEKYALNKFEKKITNIFLQ